MTLLKQMKRQRAARLFPETGAEAILVDWSRNDICPHSIPISRAPKERVARLRPGQQQASHGESAL